MNKKLVALVGSVVMLGGVVAGAASCGKRDKSEFTVAYLAGGRGESYVEKLVEGFEKTDYVKQYMKDKGIEKLNAKIIKGPSASVEDTLRTEINSGTTPDILFMNFNMPKTTTESFVRAKQVLDISDLLTQKVYGEEKTLQEKLVPGLLENYTTKPYGDGKVYTLPAFYSPTGLWYDASRFNENGTDGKYKLPETWADFWALGDKLNTDRGSAAVSAEHPALFTYPTAGYFDGFIYAAIAGMAGEEKFMQTLGYADGIWEDADVKSALETVVKLRDYLEPNTVAQANKDNFTRNQQAVIGAADGTTKGTALFVPNGDWLPGEMSKSTPEGFEWGFTALPKKDASSKSYVNTYLENVYIHKNAEHQELAKQFLLYYFSNEGAKIVAQESKAIIPTQDALTNAKANGVPQATIDLYSVYDGNGAVSGSFAATETVTGVIWSDILYNDLNTKVFNAENKSTPIADLLNAWVGRLETASDQLRAKIIK